MKKSSVIVGPQGEQWAVSRPGAERVSSLHDRKQDAVDVGRGTARREHTELQIRGRDGRIQDQDSYGSDPCPPKDRRR